MINTEPRAKIRSSTTPAQLRRGGVCVCVCVGGGDWRKSASGIELLGVLRSECDILLQEIVVLKTARR